MGRFTSQDSYLGELSDPPSLHRYFYGNANPTRYVDPTGHLSVAEAKRKVKEGLLFTAMAFQHAGDEAQKKYDQTMTGIANLVIPGATARARVEAGQDPGVAGRQQLELFGHAGNPNLHPRTRTEAFVAGIQMQVAVIAEETVIRPLQEAPGQARAVGVHLAQAETATNKVDKAVHYLEATKSAGEAFVGFATPATVVSGRPGTLTSEEIAASRELAASGRVPIGVARGGLSTRGAAAAASAESGIDIVLGKTHSSTGLLEDFAKGKGVHWEQFDKAGLVDSRGELYRGFDDAFVEKVLPRSGSGQIHFRLDDVDVGQAMAAQRPLASNPTLTEWELRTIADNPDWLGRTVFYKQGQQLTAEEVAGMGVRTSKNALKRWQKAQ